MAQVPVDKIDDAVMHIAAKMLAEDLARVTGQTGRTGAGAKKINMAIIIGTIGACQKIDDLLRAGKRNVQAVGGKWEAFVWQTVDYPLPGPDRALCLQ